jgi:hypothetical protein
MMSLLSAFEMASVLNVSKWFREHAFFSPIVTVYIHRFDGSLKFLPIDTAPTVLVAAQNTDIHRTICYFIR